MPIIYGVDSEKPYTALDVRRALLTCFVEAHEEAAREELKDITESLPERAAYKLTRANIEIMVKNSFKKVGGDFDNPTKESIMKVMDALKDFSQQYRSQEVIKKHYDEMMTLVNGMEE